MITIYGISDIHLSLANPKPMDIFGEHWKNHAERIAEAWDTLVKSNDVVLIAGDTSWAMKLADAKPDLDYILARPGRKIMIRGNHDYWWGREATNKIQRMLGTNVTLLNGTSTTIDGIGIGGTRGWRLDDIGLDGYEHGDIRIFNREIAYLRRALASIPADAHTKIALLHYPPFDLNLEPNEFRNVLEEFGVNILVYGHVHKGIGNYLEGNIGGIDYHLAAVDHTGFKPKPIIEIPS
jgi:predicted phosphohydrolase